MTSTELSLNRTLSDVLEDQLYDLNPDQSVFYPNFFAQNEKDMQEQVGKSRNIAEIPLSQLIDESWQSLHPQGQQHYHQQQQPVPGNIFWNVDPKSLSDSLGSLPDSWMFNAYADPTLTTTTTRGFNGNTLYAKHDVVNHSSHQDGHKTHHPVQATISWNKVMKVPAQLASPANSENSATTVIPAADFHDVKITNNFNENLDNIYISQVNGDLEEPFYPKVNWPLQDNNMALNSEDARMIFDGEYDDDLSDDEDEDEEEDEEDREDEHEEKDDAEEHREEETNVNDVQNLVAQSDRVSNVYTFVDSGLVNNQSIFSTPNSNSYTSDFALIDEEDDDSNTMEEDDLYELSLKDRKLKIRKESIVLNRENKEKLKLTNNTLPAKKIEKLALPLTSVSAGKSNFTEKQNSKKKISNLTKIDPVTVSISGKKNNMDTKRQTIIPHNHSNEIFRCMIVNIVTNKPCSAEFSRSYDLTRHQNTIHSKRKIVFRCSECIRFLGTEGFQKTFSRLDALSRHIKSKHEDLSNEERQEVTKYAKQNIGYTVA